MSQNLSFPVTADEISDIAKYSQPIIMSHNDEMDTEQIVNFANVNKIDLTSCEDLDDIAFAFQTHDRTKGYSDALFMSINAYKDDGRSDAY